jgi:Tol biopolymer transport system component
VLVAGEAGADFKPGVWLISTLTGTLRQLSDQGRQAAFSPDGNRIAFIAGSRNNEIWLMGSEGQAAHRVLEAGANAFIRELSWSPDGKRLAYLRINRQTNDTSVEAYAVDHGEATTMMPRGPDVFVSLQWARDGRLFSIRREGESDALTYTLWAQQTDASRGTVVDPPTLVRSWAGDLPQKLSVTADGRRLALIKGRIQEPIYTAELTSGARRLKQERRLTSDGTNNWPSAWSNDSGDLWFASNRNGPYRIFRQPVSSREAQAVVLGNERVKAPAISPDGRWLLYLAFAPGPVLRSRPARLMRSPLSGGPAETVLETKGETSFYGTPDVRCPSERPADCVLKEEDHGTTEFTAFDPVHGRTQKTIRVDHAPGQVSWDLSRDGSRLAYANADVRSGQITVVNLTDKTTQTIDIGGWANLRHLSWAADGGALFFTVLRRDGAPLLRTGLNGSIDVLRELRTGETVEYPRPSPDGRSIAYGVMTSNYNVWMIEERR